ncbi:hypothetical protein Rcae01_05460 [Novipirellula caenicola]|uniref:Uncharacterized protein n=1 Tax=Novipirellula caenicola TaxID=1536901 RepID=A0ABP9VXU2_9BACT
MYLEYDHRFKDCPCLNHTQFRRKRMHLKHLHYRSFTAWIAVFGVCALVASPAVAAANCCCRSAGQDSPGVTCCMADSSTATQRLGCDAKVGSQGATCCGIFGVTFCSVSISGGTAEAGQGCSHCECAACDGTAAIWHVTPVSVVRNQPDVPLADAMMAAELPFGNLWSKSVTTSRSDGPVVFLLAQDQCALLCRWRK